MCFGLIGGYMSLGEINQKYHTGPLNYIPFIATNMYKVNLEYFSIDGYGGEIRLDQAHYTVIDSGTTLSYFPKNLSKRMIDNLIESCKLKDCGSVASSVNNGCFTLGPNSNFKDLVKKLPTISFYFPQGPFNFVWLPENYLSVDTKNDRTYCLGTYSWK